MLVLPRAVVLGVATLFQPKARADEHWSTTPEVVVVEEAPDGATGAPPGRSPRLPRAA